MPVVLPSIKFACSCRALDRLFSVTVGVVRPGGPQPIPTTECRALVRIDSDHIVVIRDGLVRVAFVAPCVAPIPEGRGVLWIEPDGLREVRDCLVEFALPRPGCAAAVV